MGGSRALCFVGIAAVLAGACGGDVEVGAMNPNDASVQTFDVRSDASAHDDTRIDENVENDADGGMADRSIAPDGLTSPDGATVPDAPLDKGQPVPPDVSGDRNPNDVDGAIPRVDADGASIDVPTDAIVPPDGPLDFTCPFAPPSSLVCAPGADAGVPQTAKVDCPGTRRRVVTTSYPARLKTDARGVYWAADGSFIYWLENGTTGYRTIARVWTSSVFRGFWLEDDAVYFDDQLDAGGFVATRVLRDGTGRTALFASRSGILMIAANRIYFVDDTGHVASIAKSGGTAQQTPILDGSHLMGHDDDYIYWTEGPDNDATLKRLALGAATAETMAEHQGNAYRFDQDQTHLYWLEAEGTNVTAVKRLAKDGSAPVESLATDVGAVSNFFQQGNGLLMIVDNRIVEIPKAGGCPRVLVSPPPRCTIDSMTADGESIFWKLTDGTIEVKYLQIWRAPRSGGTAAYLMAGGGEGAGNLSIEMTPTQLFWTTETGIEVMDRR